MTLLFELLTPRTYGTIFTVTIIAFFVTLIINLLTKKISISIPIAILFFCIISITTCSYDKKKNSVGTTDDWTGDKHFESIEDAKNFVVGTWVSSKGRYWVKYLINSDGSYKCYSAVASQGKWNDEINTGTWELKEERDDYGVKEINIYFSEPYRSFQLQPNVGKMRIGSPDIFSYEKTDQDPW